MFSLRIFGATVFAEPTVTDVEEVAGLMHLEKGQEFRCQDQGTCTP